MPLQILQSVMNHLDTLPRCQNWTTLHTDTEETPIKHSEERHPRLFTMQLHDYHQYGQHSLVKPLQYRCVFHVLFFLPWKRVTNTLFAHLALSLLLRQTHKHGTWTLYCLSSCIWTTLLSPKSSKNETSTTTHKHSQCLSRAHRRSRTEQANPVTVETPILSVPPRHSERH